MLRLCAAPGGIITPAEDGSKNPYAALEMPVSLLSPFCIPCIKATHLFHGLRATVGDALLYTQNMTCMYPLVIHIVHFHLQDDLESQKKAAELVRAVVRRFKYLQVAVEESYTKILKFLTGFTEDNVIKLAKSTAMMLAMNLISVKPLRNTFELHKLVENGTVLKFVTVLMQTWLQVRNIQQVGAALRKGGVDNRLQDFFPPSKRTLEDVCSHFHNTPGLQVLEKWYIAQQTVRIISPPCLPPGRHALSCCCLSTLRLLCTFVSPLQSAPLPTGWCQGSAWG